MVRHLDLLSVPSVSESHKEFATGESVEVVIYIPLDLLVLPDLTGFALGMDLCDHLVQVRASVHVLPEGLTVLRICSSSVVLLSTIVGEWDTSGGQREGHSLLETNFIVSMVVQESWVVMVVNEDTEGINVLEVLLFLIVPVLDVVHRLAASENVADSVVHWIVEKRGQMVLVRSYVGWIAVEALTHLEDSSSLAVLRPEVLWYFRNCVDADAVEAIGLHDSFDPVLEVASDIAVALVEIGKVSKTAVFDGVLVVPVDVTLRVVVLAVVEWVDFAEIVANWGNVVSDDVDHDPDVLGVGSIHKSLEVICSAEVLVDLFPVGGPVAMVAWIQVLDNWRDPDRVESHTLDVVKMVDHSFVVSTAVVAQVRASIVAVVFTSESVREDLVDGTFLPGCGVAG